MATIPISKERAPHYQWGAGCDGWHLVRSDGLSVIQETMPPATREPRHRHAMSRQFFYVLSGTLTLILDAAEHTVLSGQGIEVEPGLAHEVRNDSAGQVEFLVVSQPPSHGDKFPVDARDNQPEVEKKD